VTEPVARAKTQGVWLVVSQAATRAIQFLSTIALARLLVPEDFGKVAIAAVAWEVVALFGNTGVAATIIQRRDKVDELCAAAFWLNATVSAAVAALSVAIAIPVARLYGEPAVAPIMTLYALGFVISAAGTINSVLLTRDVAFGRLAVVDFAGAVAGAAGAVALALLGFGFWSLVIHAPLVALLRVALLWRLHPWRPGLKLRTDLWKDIFGYGRWVLGADLATYLNQNGDYMITGKILGQHALGIYSMAYRVANWPVEAGVWLIARVAFPTLAGLQEDAERLRTACAKMLRVVALVAFPAIAVLFVVAPDLVGLLYGAERWGAAAPLIRILLVYVLFRSIGSAANQAILATGGARVSFIVGVSVTPLLFAGVLYGARFGVTGVAVATSIVLGAAAAAIFAVGTRAAGLPLGGAVAALGPGAATGFAALALSFLAAGTARIAVSSVAPGAGLQVARAAGLVAAIAVGVLSAWGVAALGFKEEFRLLLGGLGEGALLERWRQARRGLASILTVRSK